MIYWNDHAEIKWEDDSADWRDFVYFVYYRNSECHYTGSKYQVCRVQMRGQSSFMCNNWGWWWPVHKSSILWIKLSFSIAKRFGIIVCILAYLKLMYACKYMYMCVLQFLVLCWPLFGCVHPMNTIVWLPIVSINIRNLSPLFTVKYNTHMYKTSTPACS